MTSLGLRQQMVDRIAVFSAKEASVVIPLQNILAKRLVGIQTPDGKRIDDDCHMLAHERDGQIKLDLLLPAPTFVGASAQADHAVPVRAQGPNVGTLGLRGRGRQRPLDPPLGQRGVGA
ncbi:hypothetical protein D3C81_1954650 [compost metagenome]